MKERITVEQLASEFVISASYLSQSHFIQQFKEVVGITPKKYRDTHHNVKWNEKIWSEGDKTNSSSEAM